MNSLNVTYCCLRSVIIKSSNLLFDEKQSINVTKKVCNFMYSILQDQYLNVKTSILLQKRIFSIRNLLHKTKYYKTVILPVIF